MALRHVARLTAWVLACGAVPVVLGLAFGRRWIAIGAIAAVVATVLLVVWLPRAAHRAFTAGRHRDAARRYRLLAAVAFSAARERAALLSRAGAAIARGRFADGAQLLARLDGATLDTAERVTWLNNRACLALEAAHDAAAALTLADEAVALRPDVPAIQHTRASALVALGRCDEAITILDAMRAGGELTPALEVDRCRELARAWELKGQLDYAADYRDRARLVAP